jgi:cell division protein FtsN
MRVYVPVLISVLLGAVVAGLLFFLPAVRQNDPREARRPAQGAPRPTPARTIRAIPTAVPTPVRTEAARPLPTVSVEAAAPSSPDAGGDLAGDALRSAQRLLSAGRLHDAQDEFIQVLLVAPNSEEAWTGLVQVRRRLARDDPALLRRQAAAYQRAIARGEETEEHYTPVAMRILAQASLQAAQQIERGLPPSSRRAAPTSIVLEATPAPTPTRAPSPAARPVPASTPRPRATRRPTPPPTSRAVRPASPTLSPPRVARTPVPTPQPSLDENEPFFLIQIGPIYDATRASEIAADLTVSGYAARVSRPGGGSFYFITLGPYRRSALEPIVNRIRRRFGAGLPLSVTPAP